MRQLLKHMAGPAVHPATPANDDAPAAPHRTARLPGADRRIVRKRLTALAKDRGPQAPDLQPA
jgi:hypothetical protein